MVSMDDDTQEEISLTPYERDIFARMGSVNTSHHFIGTVREDQLRQRIGEILDANRYLAGRLVLSSQDGEDKGKLVIQLPSVTRRIDVGRHFKVERYDSNPFQGLRIDQVRRMFEHCIVKIGYDSMGVDDDGTPITDEEDRRTVLYRITLISYPEGFSVITSMSHVIGDGKVFYRLVGMLSIQDDVTDDDTQKRKKSIVESLCPHRLPDFQCSVDRLVSKAMSDCMNSWSLLAGYIFHYLLFPKTCSRIFRVNQRYIDQQKKSFHERQQQSKEGSISANYHYQVKYISTNDIVMATLASSEIFDSEFASLTLNLRDRIYTGHEDDWKIPTSERASNLNFPVVVMRDELLLPESIRARVDSWSGKDSMSSSLPPPSCPSLLQQLRMHGVYFASNWAGLQEPLRFPNGTCVHHIPLNLGGGANGIHAALIFDLQNDRIEDKGKGQVGLAITSTAEIIERIGNHDMIEEVLL